MPEIRLAVFLPDEADLAALAARLHGATVELCKGSLATAPEGCDAILLAAPVEVELVERIIASKIHVLLSTAPPREALEQLFHTARAHGVQLAVTNPDRFLPSRQLVRKQLAALGEPGLIRLHRWEASANEADLPGALVRDLDMIRWLMGRRPDSVFALQKSDSTGRFIQVHLGFPGGGMALLDYTNRLPAGDGYQSLSVIAANGAAITESD